MAVSEQYNFHYFEFPVLEAQEDLSIQYFRSRPLNFPHFYDKNVIKLNYFYLEIHLQEQYCLCVYFQKVTFF